MGSGGGGGREPCPGHTYRQTDRQTDGRTEARRTHKTTGLRLTKPGQREPAGARELLGGALQTRFSHQALRPVSPAPPPPQLSAQFKPCPCRHAKARGKQWAPSKALISSRQQAVERKTPPGEHVPAREQTQPWHRHPTLSISARVCSGAETHPVPSQGWWDGQSRGEPRHVPATAPACVGRGVPHRALAPCTDPSSGHTEGRAGGPSASEGA